MKPVRYYLLPLVGLIVLFLLAAVGIRQIYAPAGKDTASIQTAGAAPIYPDYTDITLPVNVAPLNFYVRGDVKSVKVYAGNELLTSGSDRNVTFSGRRWKRFLQENCGQTVPMRLEVKSETGTQNYGFTWTVSPDSIDKYLTYRLIEPDYEVFQNLEIRERCTENFDERAISTYHLTGNRCMNCHQYDRQNPNHSMLYVRGDGGGALLNEGGHLRKLNLKTDGMVSSSVYYGFSPSGRYLVFSTNVIVPAFHSDPAKRLEVFDSASDIYVADLQDHTILHTPLLADTAAFETFPTFSPDGKYIYFCRAPQAGRVEDLQYDLCRIAFNEQTGKTGTGIEHLVIAEKGKKQSVCHPKVSPDGQYILYTVADYGTFPIWHPEADLQLLNLRTGAIDTLAAVNSDKSDTYHSWSSNSRWFVFASKRDDGLYGKPYFCHVGRDGNTTKPFVLPQRDPAFYDDNLKSFNIPDLGTGPLPFHAADVVDALKQEAENFREIRVK